MDSLATNELKTGDILHCKREKLISKIIRWFTRSEFASHTAVVIECWGQLYIVEAQSDGVNAKSINSWKAKYNYEVIVAKPKIGPKDPISFSIKAFSKIGNTGYDFESLLIKHPWYTLTGKWKTEIDPQEKMFCSEYVAWLWRVENSNRINPNDLMKHTKADPNFTHYKLIY